jgi:hypothetical protein
VLEDSQRLVDLHEDTCKMDAPLVQLPSSHLQNQCLYLKKYEFLFSSIKIAIDSYFSASKFRKIEKVLICVLNFEPISFKIIFL